MFPWITTIYVDASKCRNIWLHRTLPSRPRVCNGLQSGGMALALRRTCDRYRDENKKHQNARTTMGRTGGWLLDHDAGGYKVTNDSNDDEHRKPDLAIITVFFEQLYSNRSDQSSNWERGQWNTLPRHWESEFKPQRTQ